MTPEEFIAVDVAAQQAVVAAVLVRDGVEDLHAAGAFDDRQTPVLNRLVRQEMLQACTSAQIGGAAHEDYLFELAEDGREEPATISGCFASPARRPAQCGRSPGRKASMTTPQRRSSTPLKLRSATKKRNGQC
jgi:hypothetical protein